jgi:hypothetical protein
MTATMEFANDLLAALRDQVRPAQKAAQAPGIDWAGLHARLAAGHAARCELLRGDSLVAAPIGAFANWRTREEQPGKSLPSVNPTDSADIKNPQGNTGETAGEPLADGRGQE